jgi:hypothetical protein
MLIVTCGAGRYAYDHPWPRLREALRLRQQMAQSRRFLMTYRQPPGSVLVSARAAGLRSRWNEQFMGCRDASSVGWSWMLYRCGAGPLPFRPLFMHARRNARGDERLVAVCPGAIVTDTAMRLHVLVLTPAEIDDGLANFRRYNFNWNRFERAKLFELPVDRGALVEISAGQPDPRDASRFIIPFKCGDRRGKIHGRLRGDAVVMTVANDEPEMPTR